MNDFPPGMVWLVGAGPGDPELLTRKAERLVKAGTVIFYDAFVGPDMLELAQDTACLVSVGKRAGRHSMEQSTIGRLIVAAAQRGERVVRLKGGDPSVFGRSTEELEACREAGVRVAVCPGITAASAAAASLGLSLTMRGTARKLVFVTAHARDGEKLDLDWKSLADPKATLAVYMGKAAAGEVSDNLRRAGMPSDTPVRLVENASLPGETRFCTRLELLPSVAERSLGSGPAIILIGESLRNQEEGRGRSSADVLCGGL